MRFATGGKTLAAFLTGYAATCVTLLMQYLDDLDTLSDVDPLTIVRGALYALLGGGVTGAAYRTPAPTQPVPPVPQTPGQGRERIERPIALPSDPVETNEPSYFLPAEFACKGMHCNCESPPTDPELLDVLNGVRERFGPVIINSGYRCPQFNVEVGGAKDSYHMKSMAADIRVPGASTQEVYDYLDGLYPNRYGVGAYNSFSHIDVRRGSAARKPAPDQEWRRLPDIDLN